MGVFTGAAVGRILGVETAQHIITFIAAALYIGIFSIARTVAAFVAGYQYCAGYVYNQNKSPLYKNRLLDYITQ